VDWAQDCAWTCKNGVQANNALRCKSCRDTAVCENGFYVAECAHAAAAAQPPYTCAKCSEYDLIAPALPAARFRDFSAAANATCAFSCDGVDAASAFLITLPTDKYGVAVLYHNTTTTTVLALGPNFICAFACRPGPPIQNTHTRARSL
jgi:hypothetical protein